MADGSAEGIAVKRILLVLAVGFLSYDTNPLHAESRMGRWMRRGMVAGYCAASAVDGWQSTRPGVVELNPALRGSGGGVNVARMVTFKAATCGSLIVAEKFRRARKPAATVGMGALLSVQVLTDVHNGKAAR